ncbi:MAG TPA: hypothetical protein VK615_17755, partial [Candidatus Binatia bacterium]|nr:hypothetical protein [Candidatus Binatia bacterium]
GLGWPGDATLFARPLNAIAYGPGAFVAVGDEGLIVQSQSATAGATNEWTKATSGYWEENYWSLGQLPSIEQAAVAFRNPGFKALAIGANTTANYRDSLSIRNLLVYDPANLLLLNWAGLEVPLSISSDFTLGPGASLLSYHSALNAGNFNVSGIATFAEQSVATIGDLWIHGAPSPRAELNISNAIVSSGALFVGGRSGMGGYGTLNHYAGTNHVTGFDGLNLSDGSTYNLSNGTVIARNATIGGGGPQFNMANGSVQVEGRIRLANGNFLLQGGTVQAGEINTQTGRFTQSAGSNVVGNLGVAYASQFQGAEYLFSGGTLVSGDVSIGDGFMVTGTFEQSGGIHNNSGEIRLWGYERTVQHHTAGYYKLSAGILSANRINVFGGSFTQSGGTNRVGDMVLDFQGGFSLTGGLLNSSNCVFAGATGSLPYYSPAVFVQSNGIHTVEDRLSITKTTSLSFPRGGIYRLEGGTLISRMVDAGDQFAQAGGSHTNRQYITVDGRYTLSGGYLVSPALNIYGGDFTQTGGTNRTDGIGMFQKSTFYLGGGTLSTINLRVGSSDVSGRDGRSWFVHSNGNQFVSNSLVIDPGFYRLDAGNLGASNIVIYPDSELWINGGNINNPGTLTMYDGKILAQGAHQLGKLVVATGPLPFFTDSDPFSTLDLQNGNAVIRFQDSRDRASEWNGRLIIRNWSGATNGGGTDRVYVGTTAQGLNAAQLGTIIFENPAGLPVGSYPARILSTGEIVPAARPAMMFSRSANRLVISWSGDYWLLTATNVAGPFTAIMGATSPYTNLFTGPQRYFQLRSPGFWP